MDAVQSLKERSLTEVQFQAAVGVGAAILVLLIVRLRFCYAPTAPDRPEVPELTVQDIQRASRSIDNSQTAYGVHLKNDSLAAGIRPAATPSSMSQVFEYRRHDDRTMLRPGTSPVNAVGLRLRLVLQSIRGNTRKQMVLEITNTTDDMLAYRIETRPSKGTKPCHRKKNLLHNAIAITPGEIELRSECLYRKGWGLEILSVETMKLPELSYVYVSAMSAEQLGLDLRTTRSHQAPNGAKICDRVHSANIRAGLTSGTISWRDMVDFYGRHRCQTYTIPNSYRAFREAGQLTLPATD